MSTVLVGLLVFLHIPSLTAAFTTFPTSASVLSSLLPWSRPAEKRALVSELWVPEDTYAGPTFFE